MALLWQVHNFCCTELAPFLSAENDGCDAWLVSQWSQSFWLSDGRQWFNIILIQYCGVGERGNNRRLIIAIRANNLLSSIKGSLLACLQWSNGILWRVEDLNRAIIRSQRDITLPIFLPQSPYYTRPHKWQRLCKYPQPSRNMKTLLSSLKLASTEYLRNRV